MSAKHTPGPWQAVRNSVYWEIRIAHEGKFDRQLGDLCATGCEPGHDSGEEEANARLCAAAPDLLDALEELRSAVVDLDQDEESSVTHCENLLRKARLAIAKARGEA